MNPASAVGELAGGVLRAAVATALRLSSLIAPQVAVLATAAKPLLEAPISLAALHKGVSSRAEDSHHRS
jgi:hypothetical protein